MDSSPTAQFVMEQLRTLYDAEKRLTKALPRMAKAASDQQLADGFRRHAGETKEQTRRIEQISQAMGVKTRRIPCTPIAAVIEEGQKIMSADMEDSVRDIGLAAAGRRVEHFEIACYDALAAILQGSKQNEPAQLLRETLAEENETDKKLATITKRLVKEMARLKPAQKETEQKETARKETARKETKMNKEQERSRSASSTKAHGESSGRSTSHGSAARTRQSSGDSGHTGNMTTNHDEIRRWAEERGGKPACVEGTGGKGDIGMLRIEFPGKPNANDSKLHEITWDEFFGKFDERGLAMVYQDTTAGGEKSNFNKLVSRETDQTEKPKSRTAGGH